MTAFKTELMTHQRCAFNKLSRLKVGALFMDMGTGKSRVFIELAVTKVQQRKAARTVILCPVSGKQHLAAEVFKHTGIDAVVHGDDYAQNIGAINIIGTESISSSIKAINKLSELCTDAVVIVDESHQIKNMDAKRSERILQATRQCQYKYISTGTPMSNGIEDLWAPCQFLSPLVLGYRSYSEFQRIHLQHAMDDFGHRGQGRIIARYNTDLIAKRLAPYSFEARKSDCLDLPAKTYSFATAKMSDDLRAVYEQTKQAILHGKKAFEADDATIYRLFTSLQMVASGQTPEWLLKLLKLEGDHFINPKMTVLQEQLTALPKNAKTIIWCKYLSEADQAAAKASAEGRLVVRMDGRMSLRERQASLDAFKGQSDTLVATTATGGAVLDMGFADYAIYLSNSFDYQVRAQSEDRIHRIGMSTKAHYMDIYTECGIERRIQRSLNRKENAAMAFMDHIRSLRALPPNQANEALQQEIETL